MDNESGQKTLEESMHEAIVKRYGPVVSAADLQEFLVGQGEEPKQANTAAREIMYQLLNRVPGVVFICLRCQNPAGICRCPSQGGESVIHPGVWVYFMRPRRWVVTRASLLELTSHDLIPLAPALSRRLITWLQYLQKTA